MSISTATKYLPPADPSMPGMALQITKLVDSYMIWVGVAESADGVDRASAQGRLCKDWACGMPPKREGQIASATSLFRSESSDVALSMAQRLARRLGKQMFVSVDLPVTELGERMVLLAERGIVSSVELL